MEFEEVGVDELLRGLRITGRRVGQPYRAPLVINAVPDPTRANIATAVRAMEMTHPFYLEGIKFNLDSIERVRAHRPAPKHH